MRTVFFRLTSWNSNESNLLQRPWTDSIKWSSFWLHKQWLRWEWPIWLHIDVNVTLELSCYYYGRKNKKRGKRKLSCTIISMYKIMYDIRLGCKLKVWKNVTLSTCDKYEKNTIARPQSIKRAQRIKICLNDSLRCYRSLFYGVFCLWAVSKLILRQCVNQQTRWPQKLNNDNNNINYDHNIKCNKYHNETIRQTVCI